MAATSIKRARFSKTRFAEALATAREAGLPVSRVLISPDGNIDLRCGPIEPVDMFDETDMRR